MCKSKNYSKPNQLHGLCGLHISMQQIAYHFGIFSGRRRSPFVLDVCEFIALLQTCVLPEMFKTRGSRTSSVWSGSCPPEGIRPFGPYSPKIIILLATIVQAQRTRETTWQVQDHVEFEETGLHSEMKQLKAKFHSLQFLSEIVSTSRSPCGLRPGVEFFIFIFWLLTLSQQFRNFRCLTGIWSFLRLHEVPKAKI